MSREEGESLVGWYVEEETLPLSTVDLPSVPPTMTLFHRLKIVFC